MRPDITIGPGTYTIVDSSSSTWVWNSTSLYMGFTRVVTIPSNSAPVITSDGGGPTTDVYVKAGSTFITDVDATDPDGDALTYRILGLRFSPMMRMLVIDPVAGVLTFAPNISPAFLRGLPAPGVLGSVTVEVRDNGSPSLYDTQVITINLVP